MVKCLGIRDIRKAKYGIRVIKQQFWFTAVMLGVDFWIFSPNVDEMQDK